MAAKTPHPGVASVINARLDQLWVRRRSRTERFIARRPKVLRFQFLAKFELVPEDVVDLLSRRGRDARVAILGLTRPGEISRSVILGMTSGAVVEGLSTLGFRRPARPQ